MRAIKDEVFSSLSRQFKGEPSDYETFLHHPRRVLAGVVGDDPAEDTTASTRDESSPRPPASSTVEMCWLRDDEYLPLPDGVRPKCDIELRRKHQVVKIKCYDKAKTVLIDFTVPLRDWLPLVRKKFDRDDDTELTLYLSGEPQPLDVGQPLFDQEQLSLGIVLCLRRPDDPVDKPTPWFKHRAALSLTRGGLLRDTTSNAKGTTLNSPSSMSAATNDDVAGALASPNSAMRGTIYIYANNKHKWEKRWFVLDNDLLFYYKNASEGKATDVIDVQQYLLKEGEVKKKSYAWDLILSPNAKLENVDGKKLQNYSLKSESALERKEWMAALQKIMDRSGSKNGPMPSPPPLLTATSANLSVKKIKKDRAEMLFGRPLELAVHNPDGSQIPALIVKCINYIDNERILAVEGIFRLSGSAVLMDKYAARFDKGEDVDLTPEQDPHTVTGLLKYYFRELPEPLMTVPLYEHFISASGTTDKALQLRFLRHLVNRLPPINKSLLHYLFSFLVRVAANADKNKMAPTVIATVFAPALLRRADQDPIAAMADTPKINSIVVVLIQEFEYVFRGKDIDPRLTAKGMGAVCCRAQHDYEAKSPDELSFTQGAVMRIVVEDHTWPYCESKSGNFGRIPSSYVQVMTTEQSQEYAEQQQIKQRTKKAIEENEEQQKELKALSEENEELAREVEELLLKKKKVELDFYMLREVLLPVMEKSIVVRDEEQSRDSTGRRPQRKLPDGDADKKEEVLLADFPKYLDKFFMESENHRRALDAVGTAKDQFLTSLEMFLGAIPVARHKKEKYQKLRQSAQVIKDKTKAEAFCRMELSELKDDIIRDLTELQGALKFSVKRPWTEEEEEQYSPLAKTLMPPMLQQQQPLSARGSSRSSSNSSSSSSNRDGPLLSARGSRERP